ncbi:unnamed protein product [Microthlaspi erraticum]|uniref:Uncharacterized protein n=1 Tax=Microthlaspi erraticum TaxID=1685480 RepID=A0A6D2HDC9_9BRAS|nr:unnamed protein product [Microthlaspi erraticum]
MDTFVIVIIIVCAGIVLPALVLCCFLTHRKEKPLSHPRDLEMGKTGTKDGGLVVLTRNVSTTAAAVTIADSDGGGGCCCGGGDGGGDGGDDGGGDGDGGGCGGCGGRGG